MCSSGCQDVTPATKRDGSLAADLRALAPVLAVWAHPDDESFVLGAILATLSESGVGSSVLCFTHGEASTLGSPVGDLGDRRADELRAAAILGVAGADLLDYPDGSLAEIPGVRNR